MAESAQTVSVDDVVQIAVNDEHIATGFAASFLVVTELRSWGVQGFAPMIERGKMPACAYYRVSYEDIDRIGRAAWVTKDDDEPEEAPDV